MPLSFISTSPCVCVNCKHSSHNTTHWNNIHFILMCIKCTLFAWLGLCMFQEDDDDDDDDESVRMCIKTGFFTEWIERCHTLYIYICIVCNNITFIFTDAHLSVDYFIIIVWMYAWFYVYVPFIEKWCVFGFAFII